MSALADSKDVLRQGAVRTIERRAFLKQGLSLGALTLLTGCDVTDQDSVQTALNVVSRWNDRVQAALFTHRLVPTYPESAAVKDFRYNAYYGEDAVPKIDGASFKLGLSGLIDNRKPWTLPELYALPQTSQVDASRLRRGLEHDRQVDRRAVPHVPRTHWRGSFRQICRLRMRRRILLQHRDGVGPAPANFAHVQDFR